MPALPSDHPDERPLSPLARVSEAVAALVLGAVVGLIGTFGHQLTWSALGVAVPSGLLAALAAVTTLVAGIRIAVDSRLLAGLAALGVVAAVGFLAIAGGNGGTVLIPQNLAGIAWALAPTLVSAVILGWPRLRAVPLSGPSGSSGRQ